MSHRFGDGAQAVIERSTARDQLEHVVLLEQQTLGALPLGIEWAWERGGTLARTEGSSAFTARMRRRDVAACGAGCGLDDRFDRGEQVAANVGFRHETTGAGFERARQH